MLIDLGLPVWKIFIHQELTWEMFLCLHNYILTGYCIQGRGAKCHRSGWSWRLWVPLFYSPNYTYCCWLLLCPLVQVKLVISLYACSLQHTGHNVTRRIVPGNCRMGTLLSLGWTNSYGCSVPPISSLFSWKEYNLSIVLKGLLNYILLKYKLQVGGGGFSWTKCSVHSLRSLEKSIRFLQGYMDLRWFSFVNDLRCLNLQANEKAYVEFIFLCTRS